MSADRQPIRLALVGFYERHRATLDVLFQGPGRGCCAIVGHAQAQAAIIDIDHSGGITAFEEFRRANPGLPTVIVSIYEKNRIESELFLRKPVKIDEMLHAIAALRARLPAGDTTPSRTNGPASQPTVMPREMPPAAAPPRAVPTAVSRATREAPTVAAPRHAGAAARAAAERARKADQTRATRPPASLPAAASTTPPTSEPVPATTAEECALCGTGPDIDCTDPRAVAALWFAADRSLYAAVRTAIRHARRDRMRYLLSRAGRPLLCADGAREEVLLSIPKDELRRLCAEEDAAATLAVRRVPEAIGTEQVLPMESVLWEMALWTYRGRLPAGTDLAARVKLSRWPNFTRLTEIPQALRIAALLSQQALTLPFVAEALRIPQRYVFAFYGAAYELGIAEQIERTSPPSSAPIVAEEPSTSTVFGRLWRRLRGMLQHAE